MARSYIRLKDIARLGETAVADLIEERRRRQREQSKKWYRSRTPQQLAEMKLRAKAWRAANQDRLRALKKAWNAANPEKYRAIMRENKRRRLKTPEGRMARRMREAMKEWLFAETGSRGRVGKLVDRLGYTGADLKRHLERQFVKGMTWTNYGKRWHIDHIIPLASFKITCIDDPDFAAAWALTNLRPLWWKANVLKGATRTLLL